MKLFLGVDGGQSSTVALIADETGRVLGSGRGGPCNHVAAQEARAKFARAINECLGHACRQAGVSPDHVTFEAACLGQSKVFKLTHDAEIALTGATAGAPGIIVIAGTGSIAFGKNANGATIRVGGWGYIFGDEGGAFDLVRQALRASLAMEEGWGPHTELDSKLLAATNMKTANALMHHWYNGFNRTEIASLAPLVDQLANCGDRIATDILNCAAEHLAEMAHQAHRTLFSDIEPATVSYIGGVFESQLLTETFKAKTKQKTNRGPTPPQLPPAAGALLEAFHIKGTKVTITDLPSIKH